MPLASFEVVNGHFQQLFTKLFSGGTAELQLIENDDPLETGREIVATPPGKMNLTPLSPDQCWIPNQEHLSTGDSPHFPVTISA
jgi:hypothetical protein